MEPSTPGRDERRLVRRWRTEGDVAAREELIARMLPLARSIARRYANRGEPLDDLEQVACVGLLKAVDGFDPDREVRLASYAIPTIAGELKRHFRDRGWMMRVPRELQELHARVVSARGRLRDDLGRSPTVTELTAAVGADEERVLEALRAADAYRTLSLDAPARDGGEPLEAPAMATRDYERAEARAMLPAGCASCPNGSARSCGCGSARAGRSARSPTRSASRRCTSRGSSGGPSTSCASGSSSSRRLERPARVRQRR